MWGTGSVLTGYRLGLRKVVYDANELALISVKWRERDQVGTSEAK